MSVCERVLCWCLCPPLQRFETVFVATRRSRGPLSLSAHSTRTHDTDTSFDDATESALARIGAALGQWGRDAKAAFARTDTNGDGCVSLEEFTNAVKL